MRFNNLHVDRCQASTLRGRLGGGPGGEGALGADLDLSTSTPSPSGMMDMLALKTPVKTKEGGGVVTGRIGKRSPPPPLRTPTKKQRGEDLMSELVAEQLKYYKRQNELLDNEIERRKRADPEDVKYRLSSLERVMGLRDPTE